MRQLDTELHIKHRNLPHWTRDGAIYWVTFRMADSLPQKRVEQLRIEKEQWEGQHPKPWNDELQAEYLNRFSSRVEQWLDAGYGSCVLRGFEARQRVQQCLLRFDGERHKLHAAVIMPNHVHALIEPIATTTLSEILKGLKGASARAVNQCIGVSGSFWMDESYDRIVRDANEYAHFQNYIIENPAKAGLAEGEYWLYCMAK